MERLVAGKRFILRPTCALVADEIGVGAAQTRRTRCLVGIDHDMVLGSLGDTIEVVVVHPLSVVMLATRNDIAHITTLHGIVAVFIHQVVGRMEMSLVVAHG